MPKPLILITLCFSSAAVLAADPKGQPALSQFEGVDADRDGRISAAEHAAAAKKMFRAMDADRDGKVTAAEMDAAFAKVTGRKADQTATSPADKIKVVDRDSYLSRDEWAAGHAALMKKAEK